MKYGKRLYLLSLDEAEYNKTDWMKLHFESEGKITYERHVYNKCFSKIIIESLDIVCYMVLIKNIKILNFAILVNLRKCHLTRIFDEACSWFYWLSEETNRLVSRKR